MGVEVKMHFPKRKLMGAQLFEHCFTLCNLQHFPAKGLLRQGKSVPHSRAFISSNVEVSVCIGTYIIATA